MNEKINTESSMLQKSNSIQPEYYCMNYSRRNYCINDYNGTLSLRLIQQLIK